MKDGSNLQTIIDINLVYDKIEIEKYTPVMTNTRRIFVKKVA